MGKDGAETVVDGRLFHRGTHRAKKEFLGASTKAKIQVRVVTVVRNRDL